MVVGLDELRKEGIGRFNVADASQAQLLDQAILEGLVGPLTQTLGLRRVGMDGIDIEGLERTGELGQLTLVVGMIDAEDAVLIGIQSQFKTVF